MSLVSSDFEQIFCNDEEPERLTACDLIGAAGMQSLLRTESRIAVVEGRETYGMKE